MFTRQSLNESMREKSVLRIINFSSPEGSSRLDPKSSEAFSDETGGKFGANHSRIPRPPLTPSCSFSESLKSEQSQGKNKKAASMIPRSKSRKRNENEKGQSGLTSKPEYLKEESNSDALETKTKKSNNDSADEESVKTTPPNKTVSREKSSERDLLKTSSASLKSCQDLTEVTKEDSDTLYKDAQEEILLVSLGSDAASKKEQEIKGPPSVENDEGEAAKQEKTIRNFYETVKSTVGSIFDNFAESGRNAETGKLYSGSATADEVRSVPDFSSIQGHYDFTLKEISNIWKNTISLINSVRGHAVKFVEENNKVVDKEQLTLEAEMLQLALDFAISYSKLKTDSLINLVRKRLKVKKWEKSELEKFMDWKIFSALYNNDDLAAMAQTVEDLNASLQKGEDVE